MVRRAAADRTRGRAVAPLGPALALWLPAVGRAGGMLCCVLVTNHVLAGAVLGAGPLAQRPVQAFATGVVSHFVLDRVPHWGDERRSAFLVAAVCDGLAGLAAIALVARASRRRRPAVLLSVLAGMAGGAFPDLDKPSTLFFGRSPFPARWDDFHGRIQRESPRRMPQEFVVAAALGSLVALLLRSPRA